jgi:D-alanyl-D-alanine carboxypeptidase.
MSRDPMLLHPKVRAQHDALIVECQTRRILLGTTQTLRSFAEQGDLFAIGRTKPGRIVTYAPAGYSWHNWGLAFDVDIVSFLGDTTPHDLYDGPWQQVGAIGEKLGLEWGGRWKHADRPHFENRLGYTLMELRMQHPNGLQAGETA